MSNLHGLVRYLETKSSLQHFSPRPMLVFPYSTIDREYNRPDIPRFWGVLRILDRLACLTFSGHGGVPNIFRTRDSGIRSNLKGSFHGKVLSR